MRNAASLVALAAFALAPTLARADESIILMPGEHPRYAIELEPEGVFGVGGGVFDRYGFGGGVRGTFFAVQDGFIRSINNSAGFQIGVELIGTTGGFVPLSLQWDFWLTRRWSVFAEPGVGLDFGLSQGLVPILEGGGRFHITDRIALTLRVGYPVQTFGISFLL